MKNNMKKIAASIGFAFAVGGACTSASATVLTFDDINSGFGVVQLAQNYGGLNWDYNSNWNLGWQVWNTNQFYYPAQTPPNVAFAHSTNIGVSFLTDSVFDGAYFGGSAQARYDLYLDSNLVHSSTFANMGTNGNPAAWVGSGYSGLVDRVQVVTNGGGADWVMDNFTYNSTAPIPEPETYAMMLAGLGMLGFMARRRKLKAAA